MDYYGQTSSGNPERLARGLGWFSLGLGLAEALAPRSIAKMIGAPEQDSLIRLMGLREIAHGIGIFTQSQPAGAVWTRVAGDVADLTCLGAAYASPSSDKTRLTLATASVLGVAALDIYCARQLAAKPAVRVQSVTINRSPEEVYQFWRNFENLPRFMTHLQSVRVLDNKRSHWVAKAPAGMTVDWDAEVTVDRPNELITWHSLQGADIDNSGVVYFKRAPSGRGTEVHVTLVYSPPAGQIGSAIAKLFGEEPGQQLKDDLHRFKQVMEIGEVVQSDASIHRGLHPALPPAEEDADYQAQTERLRRAA